MGRAERPAFEGTNDFRNFEPVAERAIRPQLGSAGAAETSGAALRAYAPPGAGRPSTVSEAGTRKPHPGLDETIWWARLGSNQWPLLCEGSNMAPNGHTGRDSAGQRDC